jgi:hypothetical protein
MLLVPTDAPARHMLSLLGTHDWLLLRGLVDAIEQALERRPARDTQRWCQVARRLLAELDALPPRLRYDELRVDADQTPGAAPALRVQFGQVLFGARHFERLMLRWRPTAADAPLVMLATESADEPPPLACWPAAGEGDGDRSWASEWTLPLAAARPPTERRARWRALPAADRALLAALLEALPVAVQLLHAEGRLPPGQDRDALVAACVRWHGEATHAASAAHPLLRVARRLGQRVRLGATG